MDLQAYFDRIAFAGNARVDVETLTRLHRRHLECIPYENFDVLLRRPLDLDPVRIFDKLVVQRRGGWCYEMNGLFAWALEEIGFKVTRLAGAVLRERFGDVSIGRHLVLLVHLDEPYLADVGFGDGLYEPAQIRAGAIVQRGFRYGLEEAGQGWWRFRNDPRGGAPSFDFQLIAADPAVLAARCHWLQTDAASPFTQNAVVQRVFPDRIEVMRNTRRLTLHANGVDESEVGGADEFVRTLKDVFGLDLPEAAGLWPFVEAKGRERALERAAS
jgi:N-hydroxyarylamine O-acetyltransferase